MHCVREHFTIMYMKRVSVRELREAIGPLLEQVRLGEQVLVTRRGRLIARIIPETDGADRESVAYPLRGSVGSMSDDFDEPISGLWEASDA